MYIIKDDHNKIYLKTKSWIIALNFLKDKFYLNNIVRIYKNGKCLK